MDKMTFGAFPYGVIDPALLMQQQQQQQIELHYASAHNTIATPMLTPSLDPCLTPYTSGSLYMEDFSRTFIKQEELTPAMSTEQDMTVASYLYDPVLQSDYHNYQQQGEQQQEQQETLHDHQNGSLFPALSIESWIQGRHHTCDVCQRSFTRKFNLLTHRRTHDKHRAKPYACVGCNRRFDRKHDSKRHYQTVHQGLKSHPCHLCDSAFSRKDALTRHFDQKHTEPAV